MDQIKIGAFIATMRKKQRLTQRQLAHMLEISDKTISKWERGNGMPEVALMRPLCDALQINLNELFSGEILSEAEYKYRAEENMITLMRATEDIKKNIVGGKTLGVTRAIKQNTRATHKTNTAFWDTVGSNILGVTTLPSYGGYITEDTLQLLGDLKDKTILEIGCGNGHSLQYAADHGATELWGMDISKKQIERAQEYLSSKEISANLICAPMEEECGIPTQHFDLVYSVFGVGWTTHLLKTFQLIYSYLKEGGAFVFSWSHPIHKCVSYENGHLIFSNSYFDEGWYSAEVGEYEIKLANRKLSTFINALTDCGFIIEKMIEENDWNVLEKSKDELADKARMLPVVFVLKARKP